MLTQIGTTKNGQPVSVQFLDENVQKAFQAEKNIAQKLIGLVNQKKYDEYFVNHSQLYLFVFDEKGTAFVVNGEMPDEDLPLVEDLLQEATQSCPTCLASYLCPYTAASIYHAILR